MIAVGLILYVPHVLSGGFAADDWVDAARFTFHRGGGFWSAVAAHQVPHRVTWAFLNSVDFELMGLHTVPHLAQAAAAAITGSCLLLLVARRLGVPIVAATGMALLVLVWPFDDSLHLWANGAQMGIAVSLCLAGFLAALSGLDRTGRSTWVLHGVAVILYVAGVLAYELIAPLVILAGTVYVWRVGWRRGSWRWAADVAGVLAAMIFETHANSVGPVAGLHHAGRIGDQAATLLANTLVPVGSPPRVAVLVASGAVAVLGVIATCTGAAELRVKARRPVALLVVGTVIVLAGYAMIVFANEGYEPDGMGLSNRINAVAAIGYATITVALAWILIELVKRVVPRPPGVATLCGSLFVLFVAAGGTAHVVSDTADWNHAWVQQKETLATLYRLVPHPSPGTTVFTFGRSGYVAPSVPIFGGGGNNDMLGAVKLLYGTDAVRAFPVLDQMHFECGPRSVALAATGASSSTRYGHALFVDLRTDRITVPRNKAACTNATHAELPYATVNESNY